MSHDLTHLNKIIISCSILIIQKDKIRVSEVLKMEFTLIKEKQLKLTVSKKYAKPYIQKIKSIVWNQFDSVCEFENNSFDIDEEVEVTLFFLCTEKQYDHLLEIIRNRFQSPIQVEVI